MMIPLFSNQFFALDLNFSKNNHSAHNRLTYSNSGNSPSFPIRVIRRMSCNSWQAKTFCVIISYNTSKARLII